MAAAGFEPATCSTGTSTRFLVLRAPPVIGVTPESSASAIYPWVLLTLPDSIRAWGGILWFPVDQRSTF